MQIKRKAPCRAVQFSELKPGDTFTPYPMLDGYSLWMVTDDMLESKTIKANCVDLQCGAAGFVGSTTRVLRIYGTFVEE